MIRDGKAHLELLRSLLREMREDEALRDEKLHEERIKYQASRASLSSNQLHSASNPRLSS